MPGRGARSPRWWPGPNGCGGLALGRSFEPSFAGATIRHGRVCAVYKRNRAGPLPARSTRGKLPAGSGSQSKEGADQRPEKNHPAHCGGSPPEISVGGSLSKAKRPYKRVTKNVTTVTPPDSHSVEWPPPEPAASFRRR